MQRGVTTAQYSRNCRHDQRRPQKTACRRRRRSAEAHAPFIRNSSTVFKTATADSQVIFGKASGRREAGAIPLPVFGDGALGRSVCGARSRSNGSGRGRPPWPARGATTPGIDRDEKAEPRGRRRAIPSSVSSQSQMPETRLLCRWRARRGLNSQPSVSKTDTLSS